MTGKVFETALGITDPWSVVAVDFDEAAKVLTVAIDFTPGSRFAVSGHEGVHPVHDTVTKRYRHMNFFRLFRKSSGRFSDDFIVAAACT